MNREKEFKSQLLKWSKDNTRKYSWRNTKDPWKIYLIEIIAQQTQLDRADQYYKKFIKKLKTRVQFSYVEMVDLQQFLIIIFAIF